MTDLAQRPQQGGQLAAGLVMPEGFEGLDQSDVILPRWTIVQPSSNYEGSDQHIGEFRRNIDGVYRAALDVVMLSCARTRLLWSGDLTDRRPECFSRDAINGSQPRQLLGEGTEEEIEVYGACDSCGYNPQFNRDLMQQIQAGGIVKSCNFGYTYLMVDDVNSVAEGMPSMALLGAMGTSVRPCKTLNTQYVTRRRPIYGALVRLETEKQTNDRGKFYALKPTVTQWLDSTAMQPYAALHASMKGVAIRDIEPDDLPEMGPTPEPVQTVSQRKAAANTKPTRVDAVSKADSEDGLPF